MTVRHQDNTLTEAARQTLRELLAEIAALPPDGDIPSPNERDRVFERRHTLSAHRQQLGFALDRLVDPQPNYEPLCLLGDTFKACTIEFERALENLEALPEPERIRMQRSIEDLRTSLRILRDGVNSSGPEFIPSLLFSWLTSHGVVPDNGRIFAVYGGLLSVEADIAAMEEKRAKARADVEAAMASAAKVLPTTATV